MLLLLFVPCSMASDGMENNSCSTVSCSTCSSSDDDISFNLFSPQELRVKFKINMVFLLMLNQQSYQHGTNKRTVDDKKSLLFS